MVNPLCPRPRHSFWDNGTILADLLAVASAHHSSRAGGRRFAEQPVSRLPSLGTEREVALSIVPLGLMPGVSPPAPPTTEPLMLETGLLSKKEVDCPAIRAMQAASSLVTVGESAAWRAPLVIRSAWPPKGPLFPFQTTAV